VKQLLFFFAALIGLPTALYAEVTPVPGEGDPRIQSVAYDPAQVVALRVAGGYAVTVRFSAEERIETVTLGDAGSWQATVNKRADSLVIKPIGPGLTTNLTVISDQRHYLFSLYATANSGTFQPYLVTFTYPLSATNIAAPPVMAEGQYQMKGERSLWPLSIMDNGQFTALRWEDGAPLPAVYKQDAHAKLALVNGTMHDGSYIIEGVLDRMVFVLGKLRASATRISQGKAK
jgi:type IV secretion system protein VirB9